MDFCDDGTKSESGFVAGRFYAGVRCIARLRNRRLLWGWAKARAFVEAGALFTGKWAFPSGKLEGSLGGYWRARARMGFGPWSGTHQFGGSGAGWVIVRKAKEVVAHLTEIKQNSMNKTDWR